MKIIVLKGLYALVLLIIFSYLFGFEAMSKWMAGEYHMVTKIVSSDGEDVPAPTLTVVNFKPQTQSGYYENITKHCITAAPPQNISCLHEIGEDVEDIFKINENIIYKDIPFERKFNFIDGWYFVKRINKSMNEAQKISNDLHVTVKNDSTKLQVLVHDDNEYASNLNYIKVIEVNCVSKSIFLEVKKITRIHNCEQSPNYSFGACVENYVAKTVECRAEWSRSSSNYPVCSLNKTLEYVKIVDRIYKYSTSELIEETQCQPNCVYYKYTPVKERRWTVTTGNETRETCLYLLVHISRF